MPATPNENLRRLVHASCKGNVTAFAEVVDITSPVVRGIVRRWRSSGIDEEEVAALVYIETWKGMRSIKDPATFMPWLTRVAVRVASREGRRRRSAARDHADTDLDQLQQPAPAADVAWIREMVDALPDECRGLVDMKYLSDMTLEEIASRTGLRIHRIEYLLGKGRELLRSRILRRRE